MEQQLEQLTGQLQSMKARNIEIAGDNTTLEKAVTFKDHEVAKLQESNHVSKHHMSLQVVWKHCMRYHWLQ